MTDHFIELAQSIHFDPTGMIKADVLRGDTLFAGLNCFEPGQSQAVHSHPGADKFYLVLSGKARMTVGTEEREVAAGTVVFAPAGVPHGVSAALERTVLLIAMAPAPVRR